jgi:hypothetical protein
MLVDSRIVQRHGAFEVLAHHLAITWPNDSTVGLHTVQCRGQVERYLHALPYDPLLWLVVDVRDLAHSLASEIPALPWSDTEGLIVHTLRLEFRDATGLRVRALTRLKAGWVHAPGVASTGGALCWRRSGLGQVGAFA